MTMLKRWLCLTAAMILALGVFAMPGGALAYQKLQRGDSSVEVLQMQNALKALGYNLTADGKYGASTEAVVRIFQRSYGLTVDGVAGKATLEKLYSLAGYDAPEAGAVPATPAAVPPPASSYSKLQVGSTGSAVKSLQQALNILGYGIKADGIYGEGTRSAVRAFQRSQGLSVDGIAGAATQRKLYELVGSSTAAPATASPTHAPTAAPTPAPTGGGTAYMSARVKTSGGGLNMRAYGSSSAQVLAVIPNNTLITVVSYGDTWTQIYYGGHYGFVMTSYLNMSGIITAAPTAAPTPKAATATPYGGAVYTARVTTGGGGLNLREHGSSSAKVLALIPNNTTISVLSYGTPWSMVAYGDRTGFVMTSFLTISAYNPTPAPTIVPTQAPPVVPTGEAVARVTTSGGGLNLRSGASQSSGAIITIPNGEYLQINSYGETWCAVFYNGYSGYVMTRYLTIVSSLYTPTPAPIVTPTSAPTSTAGYDTAVFTRTLRSGYTGTDVLLLQQRLSNLNYLAAKDISGTYDNATMDAVRQFQKVHGLSVDGLAGSNTFTFLFSASAIAYSADYSGYSTLHIYYQTVDAAQTSAVQKMQNRLRELGYTCSVSGIFDETTYMAVISFQLRNGVNVTGAADAATQSRLYASSAKGPGAPAGVELEEGAGYMQAPSKDQIQLLHWYNSVKPSLSGGDHLTIYDPTTHISWTLRLMSSGRHADCEPLTLRDSLIMFRAFGKPSWTIHVVYVKLPDGRWTMATMHNRPHLTGSISGNGFDGHLCVHFLRDMAEAQQNDPNYGVNNQNTLRDAWKALTGQTVN